jgi:predicted HAD superfamily Cof-like phosphohydrolase
MKQMEQVIEFNHGLLKIEPRPLGLMPDSEVNHLVKCLYEEADELDEGHREGDIIKAVDSLIDSMYFALGGLYKLGLTPEAVQEIFTAVHEANMEKTKGAVARRDTGAADAIKPINWVGPEQLIGEILDRMTAEEAT